MAGNIEKDLLSAFFGGARKEPDPEVQKLEQIKAKYAGYSGMSLDHPWGSCQYSGAYSMFTTLHQIDGNFEQELGIKISHDDPLSEDAAMPIIKDRLRDHYDDWSEDEERDQKIEALQKVSEVLPFTRGQAWDLWGAASFLADIIFPNLNIETPKASGSGPIMNQMVQSGNNRTGIECYLLSKHGYVTNEEDFGGFDT